MMNKIWILLASFSLAACVTINIYFPAAEAQEVADKIIDDVWQLKNGEKKAEETAQPENSKSDAKDATEASQSNE